VLDALGLIGLLDDDRGLGQRGARLAPPDLRLGQLVPFGPDLGGVGEERLLGIDQRREDLVLDLDRVGGLARGAVLVAATAAKTSPT
jgi:hypothetical protein